MAPKFKRRPKIMGIRPKNPYTKDRNVYVMIKNTIIILMAILSS